MSDSSQSTNNSISKPGPWSCKGSVSISPVSRTRNKRGDTRLRAATTPEPTFTLGHKNTPHLFFTSPRKQRAEADTGSSHWELWVIPPTAQMNAQCSPASSSYVIKDCYVIHVQNTYVGEGQPSLRVLFFRLPALSDGSTIALSVFFNHQRTQWRYKQQVKQSNSSHALCPRQHQALPVLINLDRQEAVSTPEMTARSKTGTQDAQLKKRAAMEITQCLFTVFPGRGCVFML